MLNNTTNTSYTILDIYEISPRTTAQTAVAVIFLIVTMITALIGNVAVIAVITLFRSMRKDKSNLLIINLSITDLSMTLTVMLSALVSLIEDEWVFGEIWCDFICATNYCLIIVSMLTLCFISLDRYQAVMHPLHYHGRMTRTRMMVMIGYSWCQGILFASIPSFMKWVEYDYWEAICAIHWFRHRPGTIYYVVAAFALCFLGPGIILVYNYVKILKEARKQKTQIQSYPSNQAKVKTRQNTASNRIVWSLLVVVCAYFICTAPFSVTKLIKVLATRDDFIAGPINLTASLLGYVASAINPLIYGIFRRDFQRAYKGLLRGIFKGRRFSDIHLSILHHQGIDNEDSPQTNSQLNVTFNMTEESCTWTKENNEVNGQNAILEVGIGTP